MFTDTNEQLGIGHAIKLIQTSMVCVNGNYSLGRKQLG